MVETEAFRQWVALAEEHLRVIREEQVAASQEAEQANARLTVGARTDSNGGNPSFINEAVVDPFEMLWVDEEWMVPESIEMMQKLRKEIAEERASWKDQTEIDRNIQLLEEEIRRIEDNM